MKTLHKAAALAIALTTTTLVAQNPICPIGTYIADPTARVWDDGKLYIYGSTDNSTTAYCSYKHDVIYTSDLKEWKMVEDVIISVGKNGEKGTIEGYESRLFAPDAIYRDGKYYLYYCGPRKSHSYSEGVAWSESPLGPFKEGVALDLGGHNQIDPTIFIDDDGQAYYFWGQFSLKGAKMRSNMMELDTASIQTDIIDQQSHFFHEGSFMFKRNGIYYIVYAHEGRRDSRPTCIGYATSNSVMGPYKYGGVIIDNFGCDPESWNNHGSVAKVGDKWYVFYHRSSHASKMMRRACMEPIYFNEDGSIDEVEMTSQGASEPLDALSTIEAERACLLSGYCRIKLLNAGNEALSSIKSGDSAAYKYLNFADGVTQFTVRIKTYLGGVIDLRVGGREGRVVGSLNIEPNRSRKGYQQLTCKLNESLTGVEALYLDFQGVEEGALMFDIDSFYFER